MIEDWRPHLGRKVSLRYRLDDPDYPFSEAIGVISSISTDASDEQVITVLTKSGETASIRAGDILASKLFPI